MSNQESTFALLPFLSLWPSVWPTSNFVAKEFLISHCLYHIHDSFYFTSIISVFLSLRLEGNLTISLFFACLSVLPVLSGICLSIVHLCVLLHNLSIWDFCLCVSHLFVLSCHNSLSVCMSVYTSKNLVIRDFPSICLSVSLLYLTIWSQWPVYTFFANIVWWTLRGP